MNKIVYVTDEFLNFYRANFDSILIHYKNKDVVEINRIFDGNYLEGKETFNYTELETDIDKNIESENIKRVYESLKHLNIAQASDERLWVAMYHKYYLNDMFAYIDKYKDHKNFDRSLRSSVLYTHGKQRSKIVQNISRYWWLGHHLYDKSNKDPFHLLSFYSETGDVIGKSVSFISSNFNNNKDLTLGIVSGIQKLVKEEIITNSRKYYVEVSKNFNILGATQILDIMTRQEAERLTIEILSNLES